MKKKAAKKKDGRGGAREGAGRPKTGKETVTVSFRVPADRAEEIRNLVKGALGLRHEIKYQDGHIAVEFDQSVTIGNPNQWTFSPGID